MVKTLSERGGTGKLRSHGKERVHKVVPSAGKDAVTYRIESKNVEYSQKRILHRNMLLNCDHLLNQFSWDLDNDKTTSERNSSFTAENQRSKVRTSQQN